MSRSTKWMATAAALGVPVWAWPNAHAVMGSVPFYGLILITVVVSLAGVAFWLFDDE